MNQGGSVPGWVLEKFLRDSTPPAAEATERGGYVTRVRFADGTEEVLNGWRKPGLHPDGVPRVSVMLPAAVELAERDHGGEPHAGAWLEYGGRR